MAPLRLQLKLQGPARSSKVQLSPARSSLALALLATCRAEWKSSVRYLFSGYIEVVNITTDLDGGFLDPRHNTVLADEVLRAHKVRLASSPV